MEREGEPVEEPTFHVLSFFLPCATVYALSPRQYARRLYFEAERRGEERRTKSE